MSLRTFAATLLMTAALSGLPPSRVAAQQPGAIVDQANAHETRERLREKLREYPPSLAMVLRLDPSLMTNQAYLTPYPELAAFLAQHPGVAHNPAFYLGEPTFESSRHQTIADISAVAVGVGFFTFFMVSLFVVAQIGRSVLEHRRWLHATKIQTDAHTKIVDRFASNEDLLAYIQSPAGQRFLTGGGVPTTGAATGPMGIDFEQRFPGMGAGAPLPRILTSIQIGIVGAFGGFGLWVAGNRVIEEVAQPLHVVAILALALGLGFVVSGVVSYSLSRQFGLIKVSSTNA